MGVLFNNLYLHFYPNRTSISQQGL
jgi:hypothetical protein